MSETIFWLLDSIGLRNLAAGRRDAVFADERCITQ